MAALRALLASADLREDADTPVKSVLALPGSTRADRYGENMRRHLVLAAALTAVLAATACASDTGTRRTVTAVVTASSGASDAASPSGSGEASGSPQERASASPEASAAPSPTVAAPVVTGLDPLKVDCGAIISAADVKKTLNADIPNDRLKVGVAEVNTDVGQTGSVRCLYGLSEDKKSGSSPCG